MLLSPGKSPRQISLTPSSDSAIIKPSIPSSKKRPVNVLDEDTYISSIEKIIERDFFPDIPNLRDRLDFLEATRSGDPVIIRDAQLKILDRRPVKIPTLDQSCVVDDSISLDEFCSRYTSEDNESFSNIMEKVNRKRRKDYEHLYQGEREEFVERGDRITDGYGTSGQSLATLDGWKYTAKNLLMYNPSDCGEVPLSVEERVERLKGLEKEIDKLNTRFHGKFADSKFGKEEEAGVFLYTPVTGTTPAGACWPFGDRRAEKMKKYDLEDLRKTPNVFFEESGKKSENGYSFVKTPSPAPGVDESPFMTWGAIEGTPLRLDLDDTPIGNGGSSDGPHFSIPLPPSRDLKAHSLSREATRRLRERTKMYKKPPLPSPARVGSVSPNVRNLSPAAQKFVRNAIAKSSCSVDETLRASYRGMSPIPCTPKGRGLSRFSTDGSVVSRSPSVRQNSASPW